MFFFYVVPNVFLCTDVANDDTMIVLCSCGIPPKNLYLMLARVINVHHLSQLPDCLVAMDLDMPLVASRLPLVAIPNRKCLWEYV